MENYPSINKIAVFRLFTFISNFLKPYFVLLIFDTLYQFTGNWYPILDQNSLISIPYWQTRLLENHTLHRGTYLYRL